MTALRCVLGYIAEWLDMPWIDHSRAPRRFLSGWWIVPSVILGAALWALVLWWLL